MLVNVWWPPTKNQRRTGFSGAYWPAKVLHKASDNKYFVEYDNGDKEFVTAEQLFEHDLPVDFGEEKTPFQVGAP